MQYTRALLSLALTCAPIILSAPVPQQSVQDALEGTGINRLQHANSSGSISTGSLQQAASHAQPGNYKREAQPDPVQQQVTSSTSSKSLTTSTISATSTASTASRNSTSTSTSTSSATSTSASATVSSHPLPGLTAEQQQEAEQDAIINSGPNSQIRPRSTVQETMQSSGINDLQSSQTPTNQKPGSLMDTVKNVIRPGSYARLFRRQRPIEQINASSGINDLANSANSSMPTGQLATNSQAALKPGSGGLYKREGDDESLEAKVSRLEEIIKRQATSIQNVLQSSGVNNMSSNDGSKNHNVPANSLLKPSGQ